MELNDFIKVCSKRGYCSKKQAESWCKAHPKDKYTEDDCIAVYRHFDEPYSCNGKRTMCGPYGFCTTTKHYLRDSDGNR